MIFSDRKLRKHFKLPVHEMKAWPEREVRVALSCKDNTGRKAYGCGRESIRLPKSLTNCCEIENSRSRLAWLLHQAPPPHLMCSGCVLKSKSRETLDQMKVHCSPACALPTADQRLGNAGFSNTEACSGANTALRNTKLGMPPA